MKFSILTANYNNGQYFRDFYQSIISQTYQNWECIIVDDCSTDNSVDLIKEIIGEDDRFKFFENTENNGCGFTKRRCVELASGEICGFVDPDDTIEQNAIEVMMDAHSENSEVALIHSKFINTDELLRPKKQYHHFKKIIDGDKMFFNFNGEISHFATFKKLFYNQTSGIDPYLKRAVDQDLYLKLYEAGKTVFIDKVLYNYRRVNTGISTGSNHYKAYFWRWVVTIDAAKRRNINIEDLFFEKIRQTFVIPKTQAFENSLSFNVFRLENKLKKIFRGK